VHKNLVKFSYAVFEIGLCKRTADKHAYFGDVFDDNQLCVAMVVGPHFKLSPFDSADHRRRVLEAMARRWLWR